MHPMRRAQHRRGDRVVSHGLEARRLAISLVGVTAWRVEDHRGPAGAHAALPEPAGRTVRLLEVDGPALILGSSQPVDHVDEAAAARAGIEVARRRSGGGAVLVGPGVALWWDVFIPPGDPLWESD